MGPDELARCCRVINRFRPHTIVGYTSMLIDLARFVRDHPDALRWRARTLVNAAEGLQPGQREMLEERLVQEVFLAYGSREFMGVGMECGGHAGYHLYTDNVQVEVVDDEGVPVPPGEQGRILITDLRNPATPFIRYEIGDYGSMSPEEPGAACGCDLPFPLLKSVDGRLQDVVYSADGRKLTGLYVTYTMRKFEWIEGYQIVQREPGRITVRLLSREELTPERTAPVAAMLRSKLGEDMDVQFERVAELERRSSGKVHLVISSIEEG
jgi:phenylacetate-CoA ligase